MSDWATTSAPSAPDTAPDASSSKADVAKEEGQQIKEHAVDGGKHVAGVASEQGQSVVAEAGDQAKDLLGQARTQLASQAGAQQENLTAWLRSLADELHQMVDRRADHENGEQTEDSTSEPNRGAASNGVATQAVSQAQGKVKEAADWLEKHEPADLLDEATRFARRRPGAFLAIAAVGGLLAGRFTRGLKDDTSSSAASVSGGTRDSDSVTSPSLDSTLGRPASALSEQPGSIGAGAPVAPTGSGSGESWMQDPR